MLGGVAAGIARSYDWDPTLVRLAFVVAAVFGIGIPVYVVAWIVIPPEPDDGTAPATRETGPLVGLILLGVGVLWLGGRSGAERRLRRRDLATHAHRRWHRGARHPLGIADRRGGTGRRRRTRGAGPTQARRPKPTHR